MTLGIRELGDPARELALLRQRHRSPPTLLVVEGHMRLGVSVWPFHRTTCQDSQVTAVSNKPLVTASKRQQFLVLRRLPLQGCITELELRHRVALTLFRAVEFVHGQYVVLRKIWGQVLLRLLVFGATIGGLYYIDHVLLLHCVVLFKVFPDLLRSSGGQGLLPIDHLLVTFA